MVLSRHYLDDFAVAALCLLLLSWLYRSSRQLQFVNRKAARALVCAAAIIIASASMLAVVRISNLFPNGVVVAVRLLGITAAALAVYCALVLLIFRKAVPTSAGRRQALKVTGAAVGALPVLLGTAAFIKRNDLHIVEVDLPVAGLPKDLQGLRVVQITDIHLSPLVSESLLARAVDMANEARGNLMVVTGDLVTMRGDPLDACLRQLSRLRSDAGTFGCLGNHEIYAGAQSYTTQTGGRLGMTFLRSEARALRFGDATLNIAGIDYQRKRDGYLRGAERLIMPGATNLLLSHNPDVMPVAAEKGFDLTLAGHTHGGQVSFEMIHPTLNVARFYTPFVYGSYEVGGKRLFVSRGVGTIGVPARLGAPPEVAVLRLCAI